jgi:hypothetical protein
VVFFATNNIMMFFIFSFNSLATIETKVAFFLLPAANKVAEVQQHPTYKQILIKTSPSFIWRKCI